jgi:hypothetical protein
MGERREMTEELRKQLAGYLPFSNEATIDYPPSMYMKHVAKWDEEKQEFIDTPEFTVPLDLHGYFPTFTLRCFNKGEYTQAHKLMAEIREDKENKNFIDRLPKNRELVRAVVVGFKNMWDLGTMKDTDYVADPSGGCGKALFEKVPDWMITSMLFYVYRLSGITPGEQLSLK